MDNRELYSENYKYKIFFASTIWKILIMDYFEAIYFTLLSQKKSLSALKKCIKPTKKRVPTEKKTLSSY